MELREECTNVHDERNTGDANEHFETGRSALRLR